MQSVTSGPEHGSQAWRARWFGGRTPRAAGAGLAIGLVLVVAAFGLGRPTPQEPSAGTAGGADASAAASASLARPTANVTAAGIGPIPTAMPACEPTRPDPPFVPPKPHLAAPPDYYESAWYGSARLWAMIQVRGEVWGPWLFDRPPGLPQKTFWWSADWVPANEMEPAITVVGRRLDGPGSFRFGPGTNATADFGTAMLVGVDVPAYGCWEITARYRAATLSYIVSVVGR
jgi:hypothetical protein